ncbi:hypothetical protein QAD02_003167 [Eretmocerus hayati]|uniref:Uncharacterized protein n=1 Tax=Eretmocerus hayati TaxID=131215 RepID=A0ACC2NM09_9HYME|nr:hypothetical protein QAD02_003167 [Eretmocerus hayati]
MATWATIKSPPYYLSSNFDSGSVINWPFLKFITLQWISAAVGIGLAAKGGLTEEVDEKIPDAAFIPFGEIVAVQIPLHYESKKAEDAAAAIDNMVSLGTVECEEEVDIAKLQNIEEGLSKLVWTDDVWLKEDAGETLDPDNGKNKQDSTDATSKKAKQNPSVL